MSSRRSSPSRLYRDVRHQKVCGVCAGIAAYFGVDRLLVRVGTLVFLFLFTVPTLIVYFCAAAVLEPMPDDLYESPEQAAFWRNVRVEPRGTIHDLRHKFRELEQRLRGMEAYVTSNEFNLDREIRDL